MEGNPSRPCRSDLYILIPIATRTTPTINITNSNKKKKKKDNPSNPFMHSFIYSHTKSNSKPTIKSIQLENNTNLVCSPYLFFFLSLRHVTRLETKNEECWFFFVFFHLLDNWNPTDNNSVNTKKRRENLLQRERRQLNLDIEGNIHQLINRIHSSFFFPPLSIYLLKKNQQLLPPKKSRKKNVFFLMKIINSMRPI